MDIERLKTDPAYWDEVAPEGAEFAADRHSLGLVRWYRGITRGPNPCYEYCSGDEAVWVPGDGEPLHPYFPRPSQSQKDLQDLIPRPTQWRGPEDGLPPVGTMCEYAASSKVPGDPSEWRPGDRVEILAHRQALAATVAVGWNLRTGTAGGSVAAILRPLKSDKERAVEAAMGSISNITTMEWKCRRQFLEQCYDAGLLRLPEDTQ